MIKCCPDLDNWLTFYNQMTFRLFLVLGDLELIIDVPMYICFTSVFILLNFDRCLRHLEMDVVLGIRTPEMVDL